MEEDNSWTWKQENNGSDMFEIDAGDDLSIDLDTLFGILEEKSGSLQGNQEHPLSEEIPIQDIPAPDADKPEISQFRSGSQVMDSATRLRMGYQLYDFDTDYEMEPSGCRIVDSGISSSTTKLEPLASPPCSTSLKDCFSINPEHTKILSCSTTSTFVDGHGGRVFDRGDNLRSNPLKNGVCVNFSNGSGILDAKDDSSSPIDDKSDTTFRFFQRLSESSPAPENTFPYPAETSFLSGDMSVPNFISSDSTICQNSDGSSEFSDRHTSTSYSLNPDGTYVGDSLSYQMPYNRSFQFSSNNENIANNLQHELFELPADSSCSSIRPTSNAEGKGNSGCIPDSLMIDYSDVKGQNFDIEDQSNSLVVRDHYLLNTCDGHYDDKVPPLDYNKSSMFREEQAYAKDEINDEFAASGRLIGSSVEGGNGTICRNTFYNVHGEVLVAEEPKPYLSGYSPYISGQTPIVYSKDDSKLMVTAMDFSSHFKHSLTEPIQGNSPDCRSAVDDDPDVCIVEDISQPARPSPFHFPGRPFFSTPLSISRHPSPHFGSGNTRPKPTPTSEQFIFRAALQDLSQPKSEATLPDGVLTIQLLKHQRIALSWMVQKETACFQCSGGILADDQGLGKTISTIALILKERSPSPRASPEDCSKRQAEMLNLDDDDAPQATQVKREFDSSEVITNGSTAFGFPKRRPAAGTLIVCPTSVLRQWAEELRSKVSSQVNLKVLVYHGSNRTKDPDELARFDVVLTTYSIVSMEVPKQPLVDHDDEKVRVESDGSFNKKRKHPSGSDKKGSKNKKGVDSGLSDLARPLAKVGWFRVVLDEAQSIKNYKTQVARSCWGLRAKRRWCLSGTPIQNSIDDLYSYFRFLKYDPYAVYSMFCSTIKNPISKNPTKGYKKLQAVLKTIMLRRTKGSFLDGEPIISLPPKSVELRKIDFSKEERAFYTKLENESRDQFKEYAEAGTVKQNYVNILLMLLRLRQACDNPLLVKGYDSSSMQKSSVEVVKKLPEEKQVSLLNCLEASLALCGICHDAPEDAVVSICGHVFCKQCIHEHLTGEDNKCPTTKCKVQLSTSSVFSKATLRTSLSKMFVQDNSVDHSDCELGEAIEPCFSNLTYDSSKIKAALKVLTSLAKTQYHTSPINSLLSACNAKDMSMENSSGAAAAFLPNGIPNKTIPGAEKSLNKPIKVLGEKAIVFSQWTRMLDLLEACLKKSSIQYRRLDGTMSVLARDKAVKDFNSVPEVSVMIMSLKAASLGLNMVAACHVIMLDLWWNPTTEDQAVDRAHRIGQTRPVTVVRLTVKDTVEDRILALQEKKREMVASAFGEESGSSQSRLTVDDLKYLFMVDT